MQRGWGADAVIGVQLTFNALGASDSMLMVTASGTAVCEAGLIAVLQRGC